MAEGPDSDISGDLRDFEAAGQEAETFPPFLVAKMFYDISRSKEPLFLVEAHLDVYDSLIWKYDRKALREYYLQRWGWEHYREYVEPVYVFVHGIQTPEDYEMVPEYHGPPVPSLWQEFPLEHVKDSNFSLYLWDVVGKPRPKTVSVFTLTFSNWQEGFYHDGEGETDAKALLDHNSYLGFPALEEDFLVKLVEERSGQTLSEEDRNFLYRISLRINDLLAECTDAIRIQKEDYFPKKKKEYLFGLVDEDYLLGKEEEEEKRPRYSDLSEEELDAISLLVNGLTSDPLAHLSQVSRPMVVSSFTGRKGERPSLTLIPYWPRLDLSFDLEVREASSFKAYEAREPSSGEPRVILAVPSSGPEIPPKAVMAILGLVYPVVVQGPWTRAAETPSGAFMLFEEPWEAGFVGGRVLGLPEESRKEAFPPFLSSALACQPLGDPSSEGFQRALQSCQNSNFQFSPLPTEIAEVQLGGFPETLEDYYAHAIGYNFVANFVSNSAVILNPYVVKEPFKWGSDLTWPDASCFGLDKPVFPPYGTYREGDDTRLEPRFPSIALVSFYLYEPFWGAQAQGSHELLHLKLAILPYSGNSADDVKILVVPLFSEKFTSSKDFLGEGMVSSGYHLPLPLFRQFLEYLEAGDQVDYSFAWYLQGREAERRFFLDFFRTYLPEADLGSPTSTLYSLWEKNRLAFWALLSFSFDDTFFMPTAVIGGGHSWNTWPSNTTHTSMVYGTVPYVAQEYVDAIMGFLTWPLGPKHLYAPYVMVRSPRHYDWSSKAYVNVEYLAARQTLPTPIPEVSLGKLAYLIDSLPSWVENTLPPSRVALGYDPLAGEYTLLPDPGALEPGLDSLIGQMADYAFYDYAWNRLFSRDPDALAKHLNSLRPFQAPYRIAVAGPFLKPLKTPHLQFVLTDSKWALKKPVSSVAEVRSKVGMLGGGPMPADYEGTFLAWLRTRMLKEYGVEWRDVPPPKFPLDYDSDFNWFLVGVQVKRFKRFYERVEPYWAIPIPYDEIVDPPYILVDVEGVWGFAPPQEKRQTLLNVCVPCLLLDLPQHAAFLFPQDERTSEARALLTGKTWSPKGDGGE